MSNWYLEASDSIDEEGLKSILSTDLLALSSELIEMFSVSEFAHGDISFDDVDFELKQVEYHDEGDGNYMYSVLAFNLGGKTYGYVRIGGVYSSWDGSEYDDDDLTVVHLKRVITSEYIAVDGSEDKNYIEVLKD